MAFIWFISIHCRDIELIYSGTLPKLRIQSECRCPQDYPKIRPDFTDRCIRNGVPDNTGDDVPRLNEDAHPLEYINDGDANSYMVSAFLNEMTIEVDLGDQFEVCVVLRMNEKNQERPPKIVFQARRFDKCCAREGI